MVERYVKRVHTENVVLDIGEGIGALILYTREELCGRQIDVSPQGNNARRTHTDVLERRMNGQPVFAAVFPTLPADTYTVWGRNQQIVGSVTIASGEVTELDWRTGAEGDALSAAYLASVYVTPGFLPPRYRDGCVVSAAPMGTAPMHYSSDGQVAWDQMWTDFCDLALAGGPPHRDSLLEPIPPDDVQADQEAYERVVTEIERGLRLVTGLTTVRSERAGWVGLKCDDEEMALWLLRAIIVENVCVRREGSVLFLPAGPAFSLEKEIKNVITVVAKTHHYWTEHCYA